VIQELLHVPVGGADITVRHFLRDLFIGLLERDSFVHHGFHIAADMVNPFVEEEGPGYGPFFQVFPDKLNLIFF
jgi:hypothetical protein